MSNEIQNLTGRHRAVCRSAQFCETKKGDEQIAIGFELLDQNGEATGTFLTYFGVFGANSIDFTVDAIRNCGWTGDDLSELPALADAGMLATEVSLVVAYEEYNGEWNNKVKWVNRPGGGKIKLERPLDDNGLKSFAQRMKSQVRAAGRSGPGARPTSNGASTRPVGDARRAPPPDDSDIPF